MIKLKTSDIAHIFEERPRDSHKGMFGCAALIGGCRRYSGAVKLANLAYAAMRAGAGIARLAVPDSIADAVLPFVLESTVFPLSDKGGYIKFVRSEIDELLSGVNSVALGMGWGQGGDNMQTLEYLLGEYCLPVVIDADGLNTLAKRMEILKDCKARTVLTPHLGEFSRLSGLSIEEIVKNKADVCRGFAAKYNTVLLLKGAETLITDGITVYVCGRGSPGMATAGSGDVLSGIIAAVNGYCTNGRQSESNGFLLSAAAGAYINGLAGELAAKEKGTIGMTARDTAEYLPYAIKRMDLENR